MKAKVISLINQKGGAGKTFLSIHIADYFAKKGRRVLLVDADQQASSMAWSSAAENEEIPFPVIGLTKDIIHKDIEVIAKDYDVVVIDSPPRANIAAKSIIMASDLVVIPVQPSPLDIWSTKEIIDWLDEVLVLKPELEARFVINRKIVNTAIGEEVKEALKDYPVKQFKTSISQRVGFTECLTTGQTIFDTEPKSIGSKELNKLLKEIMGVIK
jgi:chromosome partitioning protein